MNHQIIIAKRLTLITLSVMLLLTSLILVASPAQAQTAIITLNGNSCATLADAIEAANNNSTVGGCTGSGNDTIYIGAGTVSITADMPLVTSNITFQGMGTGTTIIDGGNSRRPFFVYSGNVQIKDMTIQNGRARGVASNGAVIGIVGGGGAGMGGALFIYDGTVTLKSIVFDNNQAIGGNGKYSSTDDGTYGNGGKMSGLGNITLVNCPVSGTASSDGNAGLAGTTGQAGRGGHGSSGSTGSSSSTARGGSGDDGGDGGDGGDGSSYFGCRGGSGGNGGQGRDGGDGNDRGGTGGRSGFGGDGGDSGFGKTGGSAGSGYRGGTGGDGSDQNLHHAGRSGTSGRGGTGRGGTGGGGGFGGGGAGGGWGTNGRDGGKGHTSDLIRGAGGNGGDGGDGGKGGFGAGGGSGYIGGTGGDGGYGQVINNPRGGDGGDGGDGEVGGFGGGTGASRTGGTNGANNTSYGGYGQDGSVNTNVSWGGGESTKLDSSGAGAGLGGAIFIRTGTLILWEVSLTNNSATGGTGGDTDSTQDEGEGEGGAIFRLSTSNSANPQGMPSSGASIRSCGVTFSGNSATDGTGTAGQADNSGSIGTNGACDDSDGDLIVGTGVTEPVTPLHGSVDTPAEAVDLFDFTIRDGGTSDGLNLGVSQVTVHLTGTVLPSNLVWRLNGPDASNVVGTYNAGQNTVVFSALSIEVLDGMVFAETYTVNAYFSSLVGLSDGNTLLLDINGMVDLVTVADYDPSTNPAGTVMGTTSTINNSTGTIIDLPPVFSSTATITASEDSLYSYTATAGNIGVGSVGTFSAPTIPSWLNLVDNGNGTATLSGTPTNAHAGSTYSVTLQLSDTYSSTTQSFTVAVSNTNDAPLFTSSPVLNIVQYSPYLYNISTVDVDVGDSLSLSIITGTSWLTITDNGDGTGALTGNPQSPGSAEVTLQVSDGITQVLQSFVIGMSQANQPPVVSGLEPSYTILEDSSVTISYTISDMPSAPEDLWTSHFILTGGQQESLLPLSGITHAGTGAERSVTLYPRANANGSARFALRVADGSYNTDKQVWLYVTPVNDGPLISSIPQTYTIINQPYTYSITTSDLEGDVVTVTAPLSASWLSLTNNGDGTAVLAGTPSSNQVGVYSVTIQATDGVSQTEQSFAIEVTTPNNPPTFISQPVTVGMEDTAYLYEISGSDLDGDSLTLAVSSKPTWLSLTNNGDGSGSLTGLPASTDVGVYEVSLQLSDWLTSITQTYSLTVVQSNDVPTITSQAILDGFEYAKYSYNITTLDEEGDALTLSAPVKPEWLRLEDNGDGTAMLTGVPFGSDVGSHNITIRVTDSFSQTEQSFVLTVQDVANAVTIVSQAPRQAVEDESYSYNLIASNPITDPNNVIKVESLLKPGWLSLTDNGDGTATLSGIPTNAEVGSHPVALQVTDTAGSLDAQRFEVTVVNTNDQPEISSQAVTQIDEDTLYQYEIVTDDEDQSDSFTIQALQKPDWLQLGRLRSSQGASLLSGTPTNEHVGDHTIEILVTDSGGLTVTQQFSLTVNNTNDPPQFEPIPPAPSGEDEPYTQVITVTDPDAGDSLTVELMDAPAWIEVYDQQDGTAQIHGTPPNGESGIYEVVVRVSDGGAYSTTQTIQVVIQAVNDSPVFSSTPSVVAYQYQLYEYNIEAVDEDSGDLLTILGAELPDWLTFRLNELEPQRSTAYLAGTPNISQVGIHTVTLQVRDSGGLVTTQLYTLTVNNLPPEPAFDYIQTLISQTTNIEPLSNDSDPDGNPLMLIGIRPPVSGTAVLSGNMVAYTPPAGFVGRDRFVYTLTDGFDTATSTVRVQIVPENKAPTPKDELWPVATGYMARVKVLKNDTDPDGHALRIVDVRAEENSSGILSIAPDEQQLHYLGDVVGDHVFYYTVEDIGGDYPLTATARVVIRALEYDPNAYVSLDISGSGSSQIMAGEVETFSREFTLKNTSDKIGLMTFEYSVSGLNVYDLMASSNNGAVCRRTNKKIGCNIEIMPPFSEVTVVVTTTGLSNFAGTIDQQAVLKTSNPTRDGTPEVSIKDNVTIRSQREVHHIRTGLRVYADSSEKLEDGRTKLYADIMKLGDNFQLRRGTLVYTDDGSYEGNGSLYYLPKYQTKSVSLFRGKFSQSKDDEYVTVDPEARVLSPVSGLYLVDVVYQSLTFGRDDFEIDANIRINMGVIEDVRFPVRAEYWSEEMIVHPENGAKILFGPTDNVRLSASLKYVQEKGRGYLKGRGGLRLKSEGLINIISFDDVTLRGSNLRGTMEDECDTLKTIAYGTLTICDVTFNNYGLEIGHSYSQMGKPIEDLEIPIPEDEEEAEQLFKSDVPIDLPPWTPLGIHGLFEYTPEPLELNIAGKTATVKMIRLKLPQNANKEFVFDEEVVNEKPITIKVGPTTLTLKNPRWNDKLAKKLRDIDNPNGGGSDPVELLWAESAELKLPNFFEGGISTLKLADVSLGDYHTCHPYDPYKSKNIDASAICVEKIVANQGKVLLAGQLIASDILDVKIRPANKVEILGVKQDGNDYVLTIKVKLVEIGSSPIEDTTIRLHFFSDGSMKPEFDGISLDLAFLKLGIKRPWDWNGKKKILRIGKASAFLDIDGLTKVLKKFKKKKDGDKKDGDKKTGKIGAEVSNLLFSKGKIQSMEGKIVLPNMGPIKGLTAKFETTPKLQMGNDTDEDGNPTWDKHAPAPVIYLDVSGSLVIGKKPCKKLDIGIFMMTYPFLTPDFISQYDSVSEATLTAYIQWVKGGSLGLSDCSITLVAPEILILTKVNGSIDFRPDYTYSGTEFQKFKGTVSIGLAGGPKFGEERFLSGTGTWTSQTPYYRDVRGKKAQKDNPDAGYTDEMFFRQERIEGDLKLLGTLEMGKAWINVRYGLPADINNCIIDNERNFVVKDADYEIKDSDTAIGCGHPLFVTQVHIHVNPITIPPITLKKLTGDVEMWYVPADNPLEGFRVAGKLELKVKANSKLIASWLPKVTATANGKFEIGNFKKKGGDKVLLGFKGKVSGDACLSGACKHFNVSVYMDTNKNFAFGGDTSKYQLMSAARLKRAWEQQRLGRLRSTDVNNGTLILPTDSDITFSGNSAGKQTRAGQPRQQTAMINVDVPYASDVTISLDSKGDGPTMALVAPDGTEYGHDNLPQGITYTEYTTYIPQAGLSSAASQGLGQLRVGHAVQNAPVMDVWVNDQKIFSQLNFTDTTSYQTFEPGVYTVKFVEAGGNTVLAETSINLGVGLDYTILAVGNPEAVQLWPLQDNLMPQGTPDMAYLRLVNAAIDMAPISLRERMGQEVFNKIGYPGLGDYTELFAKSYGFDLLDTQTEELRAELETINLEDGGIYTLFVYPTADGLTGVLHQDAGPISRLNISYALGESTDLSLLIDGQTVADTITPNQALDTRYLYSGTHTIQVNQGTETLLNQTVIFTGQNNYALALFEENASIGSGSGQVRHSLLANNYSAGEGQAGLRLNVMASNSSAVDVAVINPNLGVELTVIKGTSAGQLSDSVDVLGEDKPYTVVIRDSATQKEVLTLNKVPLTSGSNVTLHLLEQNGQLVLGYSVDGQMTLQTMAFYELSNAQTGRWQAKLSGNTLSADSYELSVVGVQPSPVLEDVHVDMTVDPPVLQWRLTGPDPSTALDIYFQSTPTEDDMKGQTVTGTLFAPRLTQRQADGSPYDPHWTDGTLQQYVLPKELLNSGVYYIYLEANDGATDPIRVGAPEAVEIVHPWPDSWDAGLVITQSVYRQIDLAWNKPSNPDVMNFGVFIQTEISTETILAEVVEEQYETSIHSLNPSQNYTISIMAMDASGLRTSTSKDVVVTINGAEFEVVTPSEPLKVIAGQKVATEVKLTTELEDYPEIISFFNSDNSDGAVNFEFGGAYGRPTIAGVTVPITVTTSEFLQGGIYTARGLALGLGVEKEFELQVEVTAPTFELIPSQTHTVLNKDGSVTFDVAANHLYGHTADILLEVVDSPSLKTVVDERLTLAGTASVTISDMAIVRGGVYSYTLVGDDGLNVVSTTLTMEVVKPYYELIVQEEITITGQVSNSLRIPVDVGFKYGWNKPVTLLIDPEYAPTYGQVGFAKQGARVKLSAFADEFGFIDLDDHVVLNEAGQVDIQLETEPKTPLGTYIIPITAESDGQQKKLELWINIAPSDGSSEPEPVKDQHRYLPVLIKQ
ncbi:tandem-95 repeat protein [Anaerolineales bacterium HSG6]|nr:tandem-95 repeat protein [Anaerolineales bacterium HSG6]